MAGNLNHMQGRGSTLTNCQFCSKNDPQRSICQHCGVDANWVVFSMMTANGCQTRSVFGLNFFASSDYSGGVAWDITKK